jgi:hypothetical protein
MMLNPGRELDDAEVVSIDDVVVQAPPELCVEFFCTVNVRHRDDRDFELHVDSRYTGVILLFFITAGCLAHAILLLV